MDNTQNKELIPVLTRQTFCHYQVEVGSLPNINTKGKEDIVVCYGDYLTRGITPLENSYPSYLQEHLNAKVYNNGQSSFTYTDALNGLEKYVLSYNPKVVILEFGTNDGWIKRPVEEAAPEIEQIVKRCIDEGIITILIGMSPPPSPDFMPVVAAYGKVYHDTCEKLGIPLLDPECFVGGTFIPSVGIPEHLKYNGTSEIDIRFGYIPDNSYNADGNKLIAQNVFTCLQPLFNTLGYVK